MVGCPLSSSVQYLRLHFLLLFLDHSHELIIRLIHVVEHIGQHDFPNIGHVTIVNEFRVQVKEHRHVHLLARPQLLLLETKALYLVEVFTHFGRRHVVYGHPGDGLGTAEPLKRRHSARQRRQR